MEGEKSRPQTRPSDPDLKRKFNTIILKVSLSMSSWRITFNHRVRSVLALYLQKADKPNARSGQCLLPRRMEGL